MTHSGLTRAGVPARVPYHLAFIKSMHHFHSRGTPAGDLPRG